MPKGTLNKISADKRERILAEAALLFAERGYTQTDMAELASRAGVAKGSLYNYFEGKEELYHFVCAHGMELSRAAVYGDLDPGWNIYQLVDHVFRRGVRFASEKPEYVAMYLNVASAGMEHFADQLSREVERHTAELLKGAIRDGQAWGFVRADLDPALAAFHINGTYIVLLASLVSRHFQLRMVEYLELGGAPTAETIEQHTTRTIEMIHDLLRPAAEGSPS